MEDGKELEELSPKTSPTLQESTSRTEAQVEQREKDGQKEIEALIKEARDLISKISYYPHITSLREKEKAKKALVRLYRKAPTAVKSNIIFGINEKLSAVRDLRAFTRVEDIKASNPRELGRKLGTKVLNYENSLDGILEFLELLIDMDDELALKLFTYHLSRYLALPPSYASRLLITSAIHMLGESRQPYALYFLLNTALPDQVEISHAYYAALSQWYEKLDKVRMPKAEKANLRELLEELLKGREEPSYTR